MTDLRCSRRQHAKVNDDVLEVHCRRCSAGQSSEVMDVKVFHRWKRNSKGDWLPLVDRRKKSRKEAR